MRNISVNKTIKILLLFLFVINSAESLFGPLLAVYITGTVAGATLKTMGFAVACYAIVKSIVQIPLAHALDRQVGEKVGFVVLLIGATMGTLQTFGYLFISSPFHYYILSCLGGVGGACLMAAYYGMFSRHIDKHAEGFEWSLFSVGGLTMSSAFGAAIGGVFADAFGFRTTFIAAGIFEFCSIFLILAIYPFLNTRVEKIKI